jgi:hypothetical protein
VPKLGKTPPPGVGVNEGSVAYWLGGVDGGSSRSLGLVPGRAGVGEFARKRSRSAPSSESRVFSLPWRRAYFGGGVRGGEELINEEVTFWRL